MENDKLKFYDENTEFLEDIILDEEDIKFIGINIEQPKDIVVVKQLLQNEFIQYSEQDFKNNLVILLRNTNYNIKLLDNLYKIYNDLNIDEETKTKYNDDNLIPIIFINKKYYVEVNAENLSADEIDKNVNENIIKINFNDMYNYILNSRKAIENQPYQIYENLLFNFEKPFEDDNNNIKLLNLTNYIPKYNRDAVSSCIYNAINDTNEQENINNNQCVNINNQPIRYETFRILSSVHANISNENEPNKLIELYSGDNVKIVGYTNKIPNKDDDISVFDINKYIENINDFEKNDKVMVYPNIRLETDDGIDGTIKSIKDNIISIKLKNKIKVDNISTNVISYDKNSLDNNFYIYPIGETEIYYKNLLKNKIIAFKFNKDNFNISSRFIYPNIYQLLTYYDNIINYDDIRNILNEFKFNIDNLQDDDILLINSKLEETVTDIESKPIEKLQTFKHDKTKLKTDKLDLVNFTDIPNNYTKFKEFIKDTIDNRYFHLSNQNDYGITHFLNKLKIKIEDDYKDIKDNDFKIEIEKLETELISVNDKLNKYKDDDCDQIKIDKIYYDIQNFNNDIQSPDSKKIKYAILVTNDVYTLYQNKNKSWNKIRIVDDKNEIKICDGNYYFNDIKKDKCTYDDISNLCQKKDHIKLKKQKKILEKQIQFTKDLKDFKSNYKNYERVINETKNEYQNDVYANQRTLMGETFYKQISYKKIKRQNKYIGNEDYVDFSQQFENIDITNISSFNPLDESFSSEIEVINPYKDTKNFILIEKILKLIGFDLILAEMLYIYESIEFLTNELFNLKIQALKKNNPKLSINNIITKMKEENKYYSEKDKINITVIASLIIIIIQIQYPNVKLVKLYASCSSIFSIDGFPLQDDNKDKQLYKYVVCVLDKEFEFNFTDVLIKRVINFILKKKTFLNDTLKSKNKKVDNDANQNNIDSNMTNIWSGFKPDLNVSKKPNNLISKYLFEINDIIGSGKIYNFNIFRKPLILNLCCLEEINNNLNYYNLIKKKLDLTNFINSIKTYEKNKLRNSSSSNQSVINIIKKTQPNNFDNTNIFDKNNLINFRNQKDFKLVKIDEDDLQSQKKYFNFTKKLLKRINSVSNIQIKNDEDLKDLVENLDKDNKWNNFTRKINKIFDSIIDFTKLNSTSLTDEVIIDLNRYLVTLDINNGADTTNTNKTKTNDTQTNEDNLYKIKRILQNFITTKLSTIISKIKNQYKISNINKKIYDKKEVDLISKINKEDRINEFVDKIHELDAFKEFNFDNIMDNIQIKLNDINISVNNYNLKSTSNSDIPSIIKNIYMLNYVLLTQILYIYSSIIYDRPTEFNSLSILQEIRNMLLDVSNNSLKMISEIVSFILIELRETIKGDLISNDDLVSSMDKYREERKDEKLNKFADLELDEIDTLKLLKDIVGIEADYDPTKNERNFNENIVNVDDNTTELQNINDENLELTNYIDDYQGENADDDNDYDDSHTMGFGN